MGDIFEDGDNDIEMMAKTAEKPGLPFNLRLKAWWEGYDTADLAQRWAAVHGGKSDPAAADESSEKRTVEPPKQVEADVPLRRPHMPWDERRVEIAELVWGEGYCGPGGPENVIAMSKLLALSPEMSMLVLGAELGGPARTLASHFGVWISGYEGEKELAEAGMAISERKGMAKKAPIIRYDFEELEPFERRFDRVLSKEYLFRLEDIEAVFKTVEESLKDDGLFLITNYVLADEPAGFDSEVRQWMQDEPQPVYMRTGDEVCQILKNSGFGIRVNEDITDHYQSLVRQTWAKAEDYIATLMKKGDSAKPYIDVLLKEAELWTKRGRLFEEGKLKVARILAHKKDAQRLMSDW